MAWKGRDVQTLNYNDLITILNNSKLQASDKPLYQVISEILKRSTRNEQITVENIKEVVGNISEIGDTIINITTISEALRALSFLLAEPVPTDPSTSVLVLPGARELLAGTGITFDDSVANQRTINSSASADIQKLVVPLTDADIKASPSGAFELVPAQGAGTILTLHRATLKLTVNVAYTNIDFYCWAGLQVGPMNVSNYLTDETGPAPTQFSLYFGTPLFSLIEFLPLSIPDIASYWGMGVNAWGDYTTVENQPLTLNVDNNGAGNLTGGDASNEGELTLYYSID